MAKPMGLLKNFFQV